MYNTINICFICDKNYALPTAVAIESLILNRNKKNIYNIHIIGVDLSDKEVKLFKRLRKYHVNINVLQTENPYRNIDTTHWYVSKAAMLKFSIPNIFPNIDKILYLDSDMLILTDLSDLYNTNFDNKYAAVVSDMAAVVSEKHHEKFGFTNYFNSGMMLLNLKKCREDNISEKLLLAKKNDKYKHFMDQDALNKVFAEKVVYVSPRWNYMQANLKYSHKEIADFYKMSLSDIEKIAKGARILHLTNFEKPWMSDKAVGYELWQKYFHKYYLQSKRFFQKIILFFGKKQDKNRSKIWDY